MKVNCFGDRRNTSRFAGLLMLVCVLSLILPGCQSRESRQPGKDEIALSLSSPAFEEGDQIPTKYTCDGQDISPPLAWSKPPAGTRSFVLIMDDPDAPSGIFVHWVLFNLPPDARELSEAIPAQAQLPNGALQGKNDFGRIGYGGPCPPPGHPHRYWFTLYAVDQALDLKAGASKKQVIDTMQGHILARGQLLGTYQR